MPYDRNADLPDSVRHNLPEHAQDIYREAFNSAFEEYKSARDRRGGASREETAHKVAWTAVKQKYEKRGDRWQTKDSPRHGRRSPKSPLRGAPADPKPDHASRARLPDLPIGKVEAVVVGSESRRGAEIDPDRSAASTGFGPGLSERAA